MMLFLILKLILISTVKAIKQFRLFITSEPSQKSNIILKNLIKFMINKAFLPAKLIKRVHGVITYTAHSCYSEHSNIRNPSYPTLNRVSQIARCVETDVSMKK